MQIPRSRSSDAGAAPRRPPIGWLREDAWLAVAAPALIFTAHAAYGAMLPTTALVFAVAAALLVACCLVRPSLKAALPMARGLGLPAAMFLAVILLGLWSLTPYAPGGAHPAWAYLHIAPGASTIDRSGTLLELIKLLGLACIFVVGVAAGGSDSRARLAVNVTIAFGALFALWSFFTFVADRQPGGVRMATSLLSPNGSGTLFACLLVLSAGPAASRLKEGGRRTNQLLAYATAALVFLICLFLTASRGAFIAAAAGLATFGLMQVMTGRTRLSRAAMGGLAVVVILAILLGVAGDFLVERLLGGADELSSRAEIFRTHWDAFQGAPLMGYGLGAFDPLNRSLLSGAHFSELWSVRAAHNVYLGWLEQGGLLTALPMFFAIGAIIVKSFSGTLARSRSVALLLSLLALDFVVLLHGLTDFALEIYSIAMTWAFLLGLQFSLSQGRSRR